MECLENILLKMEINDFISLGAVGVAFTALFIAPFINSRNSKRQVVAPMRQAWINALRDNISEYISLISIERFHISPSGSDSKDQKNIAHKENLERYQQLKFLQASIELHINPKETDHQNLIAMIQKITKHYHDNETTKINTAELVELAQKILKDEWDVTKKT